MRLLNGRYFPTHFQRQDQGGLSQVQGGQQKAQGGQNKIQGGCSMMLKGPHGRVNHELLCQAGMHGEGKPARRASYGLEVHSKVDHGKSYTDKWSSARADLAQTPKESVSAMHMYMPEERNLSLGNRNQHIPGPCPRHQCMELPPTPEVTRLPFFQNLRENISWWQNIKCSKEVLKLITQGVQADHQLPKQLSMRKCLRTQGETQLAWETIQEYLEVGALKEISPHQARHLIPWFVIQKGENCVS